MAIDEALTNQVVEQQGFLSHLRQRSVALLIAGALSPIAGGALVPSVSSASTYREAPSAVPLSSPDLLPGPDLSFEEATVLVSSEAEIATKGLNKADSTLRVSFDSTARRKEVATTALLSKSCVNDLDILTPSQVKKTIDKPMGNTKQSIVGAALGAIKDAGPSDRLIVHQPGYTGSEIDAYYRAKLGASSQLGTYVYEVFYNGKLTPKNVNTIDFTEVPGTFTGDYWRSTAQSLNDRYSFELSRNDYEDIGPSGINWSVEVNYGQEGRAAGTFLLFSMMANGRGFGKPDLNLTPTSLTSLGTQFIELTKKAESHKPIENQRVPPIIKNEKYCPN